MTSMTKFDSLDSLNATKYNWIIKVRVIRIWDSYSRDQVFKGRNILLLDDKATRMHAFIWPNNTAKFENIFEEGRIYAIKNLQVRPYHRDTLRCIRDDNQILLTNYSEVAKIHDDHKTEKMIRNMEFDFVDIGEIRDLSKQDDNKYLIDVVGVLKDREALHCFKNSSGIEQCLFKFTLTDGSSSIKVCFWDKLAETFCSELDKVEDTPIIIIVASCKCNEFQGQPHVSNVAATRYYINYAHRSVDQMRSRTNLADFNPNEIVGEDTESPCEKAVAELRTLDSSFIGQNIMCKVTVRMVKETPDWNYDACTSCYQEVEIVNKKFRCEECKRIVPFPDKRFRVCLIADDATGGASFILSNREVESMVETTVYDIIANHKREGRVDEFPQILKNFEGNRYAIIICITNENVNNSSRNYFVVDIQKEFETLENNILDEHDVSVDRNSQHPSNSMTQDKLKTPDSEKSINTTILKRKGEEDAIHMFNLDDDLSEEESEPFTIKRVSLKRIKKEKV